ncbi:metalloregulator ArsR/SmtB family transcription factor [Aminiphilus sp.]|uniref:ArsR/SmtB family transcription factor n=1 Tax=Aminiphilus sp. TaxID=1872488 RepID=UPI00261EABA6|nr:metalloregulator ArsR/SmtB family transcription factor [Aminiphilus sp.]
MTTPEELAALFKVLSVETRVRMIALLRQRPLCVNALARALSITPAAVSQHLRVLRGAALVRADKRGYFVHYAINEETLAAWRDTALELFGAAPPENGHADIAITKAKERRDEGNPLGKGE